MTDTVRTINELLTSVFEDGQSGTIRAQGIRDLIVSLDALKANLAGATFTGLLGGTTFSFAGISGGTDSNGGLAIGSTTASTTPRIDFMSTGSSSIGLRLQASGFGNLSWYGSNGTALVGGLTGSGISLSRQLSASTTFSSTSSWLWVANSLSGSSPTPGSGLNGPIMFQVTGDSVDAETGSVGSPSILNAATINHSVGASHRGYRQALKAALSINGTPGGSTSNSYVGAQLFVQGNASLGGGVGGWQAAKGSLFAFNPQVIATASVQSALRVTGGEVNWAAQTGSSSAEVYGLTIVPTAGHAQRGIYGDGVLLFGSQDGAQTSRNILQIGAYAAQSPLGADSTILTARARVLPSWTQPVALNGVDFRSIAFQTGGYTFTSNGFSVDPNGNVTVTSAAITGAIQAETATLTGLTISDGGLFYSVPTITVSAPPGGGTTATIAVATMGLHTGTGKGIAAVTIGGSGYAANDVLTVSGGTSTVSAQIKVLTVDGGGAVLTAQVQTSGSYSVLPANSVSVTGGSGSGATFEVGWTILTASINNAGSGYPLAPAPILSWSSITTPSIGQNWEPASISMTMTPVMATLSLNPGGGSVETGPGTWSANGSVATALSSVGPTGAHTTVQEWFTVKNASGTVRYIPAF